MSSSESYRLLDSGDGRKLESVGSVLLDRQASQALWPRRRPEAWAGVHARHHRSEQGGGHWETLKSCPKAWRTRWQDLDFETKLTPFGHIGLFPEHASHWRWLQECSRPGPDGGVWRVLNLFAYTGGTSLVCARAGAEVCHVDAAKGVVDWARRNAALNGMTEHPIRWIVEDCRVYLERERRRGRTYHGIILDPPSFGRGPQKEVWKLEDDLLSLLVASRAVLAEDGRFLLLTSHTPGLTPRVLANLVQEVAPRGGPAPIAEEMELADATGRALPAGAFARWSRTSP